MTQVSPIRCKSFDSEEDRKGYCAFEERKGLEGEEILGCFQVPCLDLDGIYMEACYAIITLFCAFVGMCAILYFKKKNF